MSNQFLAGIIYAAQIAGINGRYSLLIEEGDPATPTEVAEVLNYLNNHFATTFKVYGNLIARELKDDWAGTSFSGTIPGPLVFTNPSFNGSGLPVTLSVPESAGFFGGNEVQLGSGAAPSNVACSLDLGAPRTNVRVHINNFGSVAGELLRNISPAFDSISGSGTAVLGNTGVDPTTTDGSIILTFNDPVQIINFDWQDSGSGASTVGLIEFV